MSPTPDPDAPPSPQQRAAAEARCQRHFEALGIDAVTVHHEPVYTVDAARAARHALGAAQGLDPSTDVHVKNLFLCDRKKRRFLLVTVPEAQRVDLKALAERLDERALRFANAGHLAEYLAVEAGAVTPLAVLNDDAGAVEVVFDDALHPDRCPVPRRIWVHPLHNAATTAISAAGLARALEACDHPPRYVRVPVRDA